MRGPPAARCLHFVAAPDCATSTRSELDDANPAARGRASLSAFGSVLHAFRASAQGCDALASARAAACADREADEARELGASADEEEQEERLRGGDGAAEETPEEAAAKEALQVTRLLLGFEPSQRLRTAGDEQLLQRPRAAVPAEEREGLDEPTEMRPCELDLRERDRWVRARPPTHPLFSLTPPVRRMHRIARRL